MRSGAEPGSTAPREGRFGFIVAFRFPLPLPPAPSDMMEKKNGGRREKSYDMPNRPGSVEARDAFHNLDLLYADQGKPIEAEWMYRRALDGKEKI